MKKDSKTVGYIPVAGAKPPSPLQTLSSKRNWDRLQIKGSIGQLQHQVYVVPLDPKAKAKYLKMLAELSTLLLTTVDSSWRKAKSAYRKSVEAEFLDYPPKKK